jgi:hypothetical protein
MKKGWRCCKIYIEGAKIHDLFFFSFLRAAGSSPQKNIKVTKKARPEPPRSHLL